MFCSSCGRSLRAELQFCDGCGTEILRIPAGGIGVMAAPATTSDRFAAEVKVRSREAWGAFQLFAVSPVGGLSESYSRFEQTRALQVGLVYAAVFAFVFATSLRVASQAAVSWVQALTAGFMPIAEPTFGGLLLIALVPFVSLVAGLSVARAIFRGSGPFAGDVYTAGAVLLPWAVLGIAVPIFGLGNAEVVAILTLFALTYSILMLYAGCSRIALIPEAGAAPAVPIILLLSGWVTKIVLVMLW